ncbi:DUF262 domain-containing protein [Pseudidiomarina mangrovi]|uniref:DUF262 domain-containing protein n=1 Tax=Pseudidiomarina mangrovi TaxID=2487133 RepID=UPI000FCC3103|nr:DUF262 domain-containing protein [Pseudidiomarina mangrovi]
MQEDRALDLEDEIDLSNEAEEDEAHIHYDIASYPSDYTLAGLATMWADEDIEIPDYQREFVWGQKQSSLLIDSFLTGLPVPPVFFYIDENNKNLVIDGQQRLLSIIFYLEGYFGKESTHGKRQVFRLTGLGEKNKYNGKRFEDLDESDQRKLKQAVLRAINIRQLAPLKGNTSAYHIFERLNTGGTPLKPQEIRNCVFRGRFSQLLKDLNKDNSWREILGKKHLDKHQKDVELILRIFALTKSWKSYEKPMKEFLNLAMKNNQEGDTSRVEYFINNFSKVTDFVIENLGPKPFNIRGPLNVSAMDSVMVVLLENAPRLEKVDLKTRYEILTENEDFMELTSLATTDTKIVRERFELVKEILLG